jgi:DNA ligase-1
MQTLLEITNKLQDVTGRKAKEQLIKDNQDNELFVETMQFLLNPYIVTGLSTKKIRKVLSDISQYKSIQIPKNLPSLLQYLKVNNTGKDIDIATVQIFISMYANINTTPLIQALVTKSLKLGITASTWNKVTPVQSHIPTFNVMLANKYQDFQHRITGDIIVTPKLDGHRALIFCHNDGLIEIRTRQGQFYQGLKEIEEAAIELPRGFVYDGELLAIHDTEDDWYRSTSKIVRKKGIKTGVVFHVFDVLLIDNFIEGSSPTPCANRKQSLIKYVASCPQDFIQSVPILYYGDDLSCISDLAKQAISNGYEGVMVNVAESPYECKRTRNLLKVKEMQSADLEIIALEEGEGRLRGTLGNLIVLYKGNKVSVGSGFSDEERTIFWNNQDKFIGRVVEIIFFGESKNQNNDEISLRFPVFKTIREVGKEVNYI